MDKELTSILRYRLAGRRRHLGDPALAEGLGEHNGVAVIGAAPPHTQRLQFWVDVERALALLPGPVRETAKALCWSSPSELSRTLGRSRTVIYARMRLLREAFLAAGIGPAYFAAPGVRQ